MPDDALGGPPPGDHPEPLISLVVPVYRPDVSYLTALVESIQAQSFSGWELILVDDASADVAVTTALRIAELDPRVRLIVRAFNAGIVAATNDGIAAARGTFVGFADHDDVLAPDALAAIAAALSECPTADLLYTDEAHLSPDGEVGEAFRKPDFSPERLRGQMYIGHLGAYRTSLLRELGGLRTGFDGSQDYDLALRFTERAAQVVHIPRVLYFWRIHPESVSQRPDNAPVFAAARRALAEHLERVGIAGVVEQVHEVGVYRVRRRLPRTPLVSIVIPTRGSSAVVRDERRCMVLEAVRSVVMKSTYPAIEFVVVIDADAPDGLASELSALVGAFGHRLRVLEWTAPFNFSAKVNRGVLAAAGEFVVLLNDDVELITADWLEVMVGLAQQDDVGLVGPMLYFEDDTIQHAGQATDRGAPGHIGWRWNRGPGPFAAFLVDREVSGVTGACALVPRELYLQLGGMSLDLPVNFNDVDFGQKVSDAGYRILWTPHAELYHYESKSRVAQVVSYEINTLNNRWGRRLGRDKFWHHFEAEGKPRL